MGAAQADLHPEPVAVFKRDIRLMNAEPKGALHRVNGIGMNLHRFHLKENLLCEMLRRPIDPSDDVDLSLIDISPQVSLCKGGGNDLLEEDSNAAAEEDEEGEKLSLKATIE